MLRLVQLGVLGAAVLGATVLMALPRRDRTRPAEVASDVNGARSGDAPALGPSDSIRDGATPAPPQAPATTAPIVAPPRATYTVVAGDTLQKIAKQHYGSVNKWHRIADANPGVDPSRLRPGTTLVVPP